MDNQIAKIIEHQNQRVLTTPQLADSFDADPQVLVNNFNRNKDRYTETKHFILLQGDDLREFRAKNQIDLPLNTNRLYLWTEKGAWLHAKSLNTDRAWEAYESLVDDYYTIKQQSLDHKLLSPEMQMFKLAYDAMAKMQLDAIQTQEKLIAVETTVNEIQDTFLQRDENWRESVNKMLSGASFRSGGNYQELRTASYQTLEERGHCDLNTRLRNLRDRLEESGATKTKINGTTKMDVIEADPRLKEIYSTIVKEISIGTLRVASGRA